MELLWTYVLMWTTVFMQTETAIRRCDPRYEFQCRDGVCISIAEMCDGYPDCSRGEDELDCDASGSRCDIRYRFRCRDGVCISIAKKCNDYPDCSRGEDELDCENEPPCKPRNQSIADKNNYPCRGPCQQDRYIWSCRAPRKLCMCDDECGWSCVNPTSPCNESPPYVAFAEVQVKRMDPVTMRLTTVRSGPPYRFRDVAQYTCEGGKKIVGPQPRCSANKTWSNEIPRCVGISGGERVGINKTDVERSHEIYFLIDVSLRVMKSHRVLQDEIEFAKRLVERMKRFIGNVNYHITVFALMDLTILDINSGPNTANFVIRKLDEVYMEAADVFYPKLIRGGTNTALALEQLRNLMRHRRQIQQRDTMRHVFILSDGRITEGRNPVDLKHEIENEFWDAVKFYSITASKRFNLDELRELLALSSGENGENFIFIQDFYQLQYYVDKVTNVQLDFAKCGQAGEVGSIKGQASLGRSIGGSNAAENAWPWQALITRKSHTMKQSLSRRFLLGGGSILNEKWILTAGHVLNPVSKPKKDVVVFVGIFERPAGDEKVLKTVEAYSIGEYIEHSAITQGWDATKGYDIALIKLGNKQDEFLKNIEGETNGLTFGYYIRPVCLPCTGTCITKKILSDHKVAVNDGMGFDEKCLAEENLLLRGDAKVVSTGFGHLNKTVHKINMQNFNPPKKLQQVLLRIAPKDTCLEGVTNINQQLEQDGDDIRAEFNDSMICCVSGVQNEVIDTCKGDSGGPVVREVVDDETGESCWVQVGIVSWGYRCGQGYPSYYVNVAKFIPWINKTIGGNLPGR